MVSGYRKCGLTKWSKEDEVQIIDIRGNYEVKVDKWYYDRNCLFNWFVKRNYVCRLSDNKIIYMHRDVLNLNDSEFLVDHIDGNTFNNCENNLRLCTQAENSYNKRKFIAVNKTSKFKGVSKQGNKWVTTIHKLGNTVTIGRYNSEVEAALAYDTAAIYLFEEFANINFECNKEKLLLELKDMEY